MDVGELLELLLGVVWVCCGLDLVGLLFGGVGDGEGDLYPSSASR